MHAERSISRRPWRVSPLKTNSSRNVNKKRQRVVSSAHERYTFLVLLDSTVTQKYLYENFKNCTTLYKKKKKYGNSVLRVVRFVRNLLNIE